MPEEAETTIEIIHSNSVMVATSQTAKTLPTTLIKQYSNTPIKKAVKNRKEDLDGILAGYKEPQKLVPNQRTGPMNLEFRGRLYLPHYKRAGIAYWRCESFNKTSCPARALVHSKFVYGIDDAHNHE